MKKRNEKDESERPKYSTRAWAAREVPVLDAKAGWMDLAVEYVDSR